MRKYGIYILTTKMASKVAHNRLKCFFSVMPMPNLCIMTFCAIKIAWCAIKNACCGKNSTPCQISSPLFCSLEKRPLGDGLRNLTDRKKLKTQYITLHKYISMSNHIL